MPEKKLESEKKAAKAAAPKGKPDADLVKRLSAELESRLRANMTADTMPAGAQGALFGKPGGFKKVVDALAPSLVKTLMILGDGRVSPDEFGDLADDAFGLISKWIARRNEAR